MTMRPQNRCGQCGYTWYPRGKNLSRKCPNCGSGAVQFSPIGAIGAGLGGAMLVFFCVCGGILSLFRDKPKGDADRLIVKNDLISEKSDKDALSSRTPRPDRKAPDLLQPKAKSREDFPSDPSKTKSKIVPSDLPIAPAPHRVSLNQPPTEGSSDWVRRGAIRTRVVGASVFRPILTNGSGHEFPSPDSILVVWVETQSLTAANVELRRWINPLNEFAALTEASGARIKAVSFTRGERVGGQLVGGHKLAPGGPGVVDVLGFEVPSAATRTIILTLNAAHVGEDGSFVHTIPSPLWPEDILAPIVKALKSKKAAERIEALEQLTKLGEKGQPATSAIVEALMDPTPAVREVAAGCLEKVAPTLYKHTIAILYDKNASVKARAVAELGKLGKSAKGVVPALKLFYSQNSVEGVPDTATLGALVSIVPDDALIVNEVLHIVASPRPVRDTRGQRARAECLRLLDSIDTTKKKKVDALTSALSDPQHRVAVIERLAKFGADAKPALPTLMKLKLDAVAAVREAATKAIETIHTD